MKKLTVVFLCLLMLFPAGVYVFSARTSGDEEGIRKAEEFFKTQENTNRPSARADGGKHRIAYVDIDPYPASGEMLYYYIREMMNTGWIELDGELPFDPDNTDARELIGYLADRDLGDYVEFSREACYYLAVDGEDACRKSLQGLLDDGKVDLIFCNGTWPGTFAMTLKNEDVPVMVYFCVDPVGAGISLSDQYSGRENVWCHVNYSVYNNQIQFYYDNYPFTNIGMIYYDENVAAMRAYRQAAKENGFVITEKKIETLTDSSPESIQQYYEMLAQVFEELCGDGIDAFMLNTDIIKDESRIRSMLEVFYERGIPVFVQNGEYYVENGALMVVTASDAREQAPFVADVCARILNGEKPGQINQIFITPPYLSINLAVADRLHYKVGEELILSAEKLYTK